MVKCANLRHRKLLSMLLAPCARCLLIELSHNEKLFFIDMTSDTARWKQSLIPLAYSEYKIQTTVSSVKDKTEAGFCRVVDVLGSAQPFFLRFSMTVRDSVLVFDITPKNFVTSLIWNLPVGNLLQVCVKTVWKANTVLARACLSIL